VGRANKSCRLAQPAFRRIKKAPLSRFPFLWARKRGEPSVTQFVQERTTGIGDEVLHCANKSTRNSFRGSKSAAVVLIPILKLFLSQGWSRHRKAIIECRDGRLPW